MARMDDLNKAKRFFRCRTSQPAAKSGGDTTKTVSFAGLFFRHSAWQRLLSKQIIPSSAVFCRVLNWPAVMEPLCLLRSFTKTQRWFGKWRVGKATWNSIELLILQTYICICIHSYYFSTSSLNMNRKRKIEKEQLIVPIVLVILYILAFVIGYTFLFWLKPRILHYLPYVRSLKRGVGFWNGALVKLPAHFFN